MRSLVALVAAFGLLVAGCGSGGSGGYTAEDRAAQLVKMSMMKREGVVVETVTCKFDRDAYGVPGGAWYHCVDGDAGTPKPMDWYVACLTADTKEQFTPAQLSDDGFAAGDCDLD